MFIIIALKFNILSNQFDFKCKNNCFNIISMPEIYFKTQEDAEILYVLDQTFDYSKKIIKVGIYV